MNTRSILSFILVVLLLSNCQEEDKTPPAQPALLSPTNANPYSDLDLMFSWNAISAADSYSFQLSSTKNFSVTEQNITELKAPFIAIKKLKKGMKYYWRVNAKGKTGSSIWSDVWEFGTCSQNHIPTDGLVAYYPFNENANDESGNGHHGTLHGPTLTENRNGTQNKAYYFDGVDNYISVPHDNALNLIGDFTVSAWYKSDGCTSICEVPGYHTIIMKREVDVAPDDDWPWGLSISYRFDVTDAEFKKVFATRRTNGTADYRWSDAEIDINTWQSAIIVVQNGHQSIYLNGQLSGSSDFTLAQVANTKNMVIGWSLRPGYEQFKGSIDDIRLYNRALSNEEVSALYHEDCGPCQFF